jgi:capsular polysaccharide biosynthesis protein
MENLDLTLSKNSPNVKYIEIYPKRYISRKKRLTENNVFIDLLQKWNSLKFHEDYVTIIPKGKAYSHQVASLNISVNVVKDKEDNILTDLSNGEIDETLKVKNVNLKGNVVFLNADHGKAGYFHWLFDVIARINLLLKIGFILDDIDYFIVPNLDGDYKKETLKKLNIPLNKIIETNCATNFYANKLIVPSSLYIKDNGCSVSEWKCNFLRNTFLSKKNCSYYGDKIYLIRGEQKWRNVLNEKELISFLQVFGFSAVNMENLTIEEQSICLNHAKVVVAAHGSALTNIIFCEPKTKIIEIFPTKEICKFFPSTTDICDLDYYFLINDLGVYERKSLHKSFNVDIKRLYDILHIANVI